MSWKNWTARSVCTLAQRAKSGLMRNSGLARNLAQHATQAQREKTHEEAQGTLNTQMCAQRKVSGKSKLPQTYKRSRKQKEKTHRVSKPSSVEIQSLSLSLRGNPLFSHSSLSCYQSSNPFFYQLLICKASHNYERLNPFSWEPRDQTLVM